METENPYREQEPRRRYESDRLGMIQAEMLLVRARNEGYARRSRLDVLPAVSTQVYRAPEPAQQEVLVAEPLELERRLDPVA